MMEKVFVYKILIIINILLIKNLVTQAPSRVPSLSTPSSRAQRGDPLPIPLSLRMRP